MSVVEFEPANELEECLLKAQKGELELRLFLELLKESALFVPSGTKVNDDLSGFTPLLFEKENGSFVSVFTSQCRLSPFKEKAKYHMRVSGREFFSRFPPNYGVVVNPGWSIGCEIDCDTISSRLKNSGSTGSNPA